MVAGHTRRLLHGRAKISGMGVSDTAGSKKIWDVRARFVYQFQNL